MTEIMRKYQILKSVLAFVKQHEVVGICFDSMAIGCSLNSLLDLWIHADAGQRDEASELGLYVLTGTVAEFESVKKQIDSCRHWAIWLLGDFYEGSKQPPFKPIPHKLQIRHPKLQASFRAMHLGPVFMDSVGESAP